MLILFASLALVSGAIEYDAEAITSEINPDCGDLCTNDTNINLVYTQFNGENTSIHNFWSTFNGAPGFLIVETKDDTPANISWPDLINGNGSAIHLSEPLGAIGIVIKNIFFWNDTKNDGTYGYNENTTETLNWSDFDVADVHQSFSKDVQGSNAKFEFVHRTHSNLSVTISVFTRTSNGRNTELPRLQYTPKSFHAEITLQGIYNDSLVNQRAGIELSVFHPSSQAFEPERTNSMDDEFSPGIFTKFYAKFAGKPSPSFLYWKPAAYSKAERIIATTVDANLHAVNFTNDSLSTANKPLHAFYLGFGGVTTNFNITFGSTKENMYKDTEYLSFSLVCGLDEPPVEALSSTVQIIILVGFGLPAVVILLSSIYICVKRSRRSSYEEVLVENEGQ